MKNTVTEMIARITGEINGNSIENIIMFLKDQKEKTKDWTDVHIRTDIEVGWEDETYSEVYLFGTREKTKAELAQEVTNIVARKNARYKNYLVLKEEFGG